MMAGGTIMDSTFTMRLVLVTAVVATFVVGARKMDSPRLAVLTAVCLVSGCLFGLELPLAGAAVAMLAYALARHRRRRPIAEADGALAHLEDDPAMAESVQAMARLEQLAARSTLMVCLFFVATGFVVGAVLAAKPSLYGISTRSWWHARSAESSRQ